MYEVSLLDGIDYGATDIQEILQNVRFIMSTIQNTCVLDREFGRSIVMLDDTSDAAKALLTADYIETIERHEPRVKVDSIDFDEYPLEGKLVPRVKVVLVDGEI